VHLTCYAEGREGKWEAICIDFDLAVQGRSHQEVYERLLAAIRDYVESARLEPPEQAKRLLRRAVPWHLRARLTFSFLYHWLLHRRKDGEAHGFTLTCPA
jgi:hypothetical protein